MKKCSFCNNGENIIKIMKNDCVVKRILYENEYFYVTVSVGALVPGHLLIIPKTHYLSARDFSDELMDELLTLIKKLKAVLEKQYGKRVILFEHGTGCNAVTSAASVIHAHIHLVPIDDSLLPDVLKQGCEIRHLSALHNLKEITELGKSYIMYQDVDQRLYTIEKKFEQSQFFRKLICDKYQFGEWDWHKNCRVDYILTTVEDLKGIL